MSILASVHLGTLFTLESRDMSQVCRSLPRPAAQSAKFSKFDPENSGRTEPKLGVETPDVILDQLSLCVRRSLVREAFGDAILRKALIRVAKASVIDKKGGRTAHRMTLDTLRTQNYFKFSSIHHSHMYRGKLRTTV
jgi:hypothetical protein